MYDDENNMTDKVNTKTPLIGGSLSNRGGFGQGKRDYASISIRGSNDQTGASSSYIAESPITYGHGRDNGRKTSVLLPTEQLSLTWCDIEVTAPPPKRKWFKKQDPKTLLPKRILRRVSGYVEPGTLLAVMGASGAGKSTLMNVLTYRNRGNLTVEGHVMINGQPVGRSIASSSAYVQQEDLFFGNLRVREHLIFQALLRMDSHIPKKGRMERVEEVIRELGLSKCANTIIGNPARGIKGISGGEMKRLSFASEVLTNPPLMFCDEPTSGLDSFMAQSVVATLQHLAAQGRTILCTIHQPSSEVYAMFDRVLLMAEGRNAFLGSTSDALRHFSNIGHTCPTNYNPADFYIQKLAIEPGKEQQCREKVEKLCDAYDQSIFAKEVYDKMKPSESKGLLEDHNIKSRSPYKASWFAQFRAVMWRTYLDNSREPMIIRVRTVQTVIIALIIGLVFLQQPYDQDSIQNINGCLFLFITNMTFANLFAVIQVFPLELPVFLREHFNGMYRTDVYFICKNLVELPYQFIILPIVFTAITYWMVGLYPYFVNFCICAGILVLVCNVSVSFGYMISTFSPSVSVALAIAPPLIVPLLLFGGLFLNTSDIPVYFIWLQYISWFKYGYECLTVNQWQNIDDIECPANYSVPCITDGQTVLASLSFSADNFMMDIYLILVLLVVYRLIAYIGLVWRSQNK
ncbi:protein white-like [Saccoglossus kowalevskii]|uniref:Protein white-like n=1 Tax=Saccoglossus kowalevskii TaxID=10224 RepID=A0ABM0H1B8_SACKO|nr:PREDICTED: protein white-like [Saccoglossus kowalevskii]